MAYLKRLHSEFSFDKYIYTYITGFTEIQGWDFLKNDWIQGLDFLKMDFTILWGVLGSGSQVRFTSESLGTPVPCCFTITGIRFRVYLERHGDLVSRVTTNHPQYQPTFSGPMTLRVGKLVHPTPSTP